MSKRKKILILVGLLLLILFIALLWWLFRKPKTVIPAPIVAPVVQIPPASISVTPPPSQVKEQEVRSQSSSVQSLAKTFVERYGSYSTEARYQNLIDVLPLVTPAFRSKIEADKQALPPIDPETPYYGVTTRVLSMTVKKMDEQGGVADISVSTQREEAKKTVQQTTVLYQTIEVHFEKVGSEWKVASATWVK